MRRAWLLMLLAACGKAEDPPPDLSWWSDASMLDEWTSRFPVANREPELKGKVLILDIERKVVDESLMNMLPRELRPATRAEIGTVVWFKEDKVQVGTYTKSGIAAYQTKSEVTLIDAAAREVFYWNFVTGKMPAKEITYRKDEAEQLQRTGVSGSSERSKLIVFLKNLPRK